MMKKHLNGFMTLLAVGFVAAFLGGCSQTITNAGNNNNSGIPYSTLFAPMTQTSSSAGGGASALNGSMSSAFSTAFNPVFSSIAPFASTGSVTWAIGVAEGAYVDESQLGFGSPTSIGYGMVALSVGNAGTSSANVTLTSGGAAVPLVFLGNYSYNSYNYSIYGAGSPSAPQPAPITYAGTVTMTVAGIGDTATSSLTAPGGYGFSYSSGEVSSTVASAGSSDAEIVYGFNSTTANLTYQSTASLTNPYSFPGSAYSLSGGSTYVSMLAAAGWTTSVSSATGVKGGVIAADFGIALSTH